MALSRLSFYSEVLGMQTEVIVILPQKSSTGEIGVNAKADDDAYKCLYLLHGLSDDHTTWLRRTSIERYAIDHGICVVMPCGGRSFYSNIKNGMAYYDYIAKELPRRIREFFHVSHKREDTFIAGNSMGGYGALKIALKECDTFCAAAALSPCCDLIGAGYQDILESIFGEPIMPEEDDAVCLAKLIDSNPNKPRLYVAMGTNDFLYETIKPFCQQVNACSYDFTYIETDASHSWAFWDVQIQDALKWMFHKE